VDLDFVRIECDIVADIPAQLIAVLYDELRNFEAQFRATCCTSVQKSCAFCAESVGCPYRIVFAQQLSPDPGIVRLHQKPSLPFSLYINRIDGNTTFCTVGMVIIGSAVNYVEFFYSALLRMVEACASSVLSPSTCMLHFYSLDYQDVRHEISHTAPLLGSVILLSGQHILQNTVHSDHVRLTLISPLRLLSNGLIAHRFDFATFFCSQLRRCSSLCAYYGTREMDLDFARLSLAAQNVAVLEDEIHYTQPSWSKRLNRAGLIGRAECSGLVEPMLSFLRFGSYFNAGKGATFGSGFHHIEVL
jgi:hypothetical protein